MNVLKRLMNLTAAVSIFATLFVSPAFAAEETEKRIFARTTTGIIRDINLSKRQAIISGYKYYFGNPIYGDASEVKLYGYDAGSFEILRVGMKVRIEYAEYGHIRYVVKLQQLSNSARGVEN